MFDQNASNRRVRLALAGVIAPALVGLCGCASPHLSPEFGNAYRQTIAAQTANPDAVYQGTPAPGGDPSRVNLAQKRYRAGKVIPPITTTAATTVTGGTGNNTSSAAAGPSLIL